MRQKQANLVKCNHRVAKLFILHDVNAMTKALLRLNHEGVGVTGNLLAGLAHHRARS